MFDIYTTCICHVTHYCFVNCLFCVHLPCIVFCNELSCNKVLFCSDKRFGYLRISSKGVVQNPFLPSCTAYVSDWSILEYEKLLKIEQSPYYRPFKRICGENFMPTELLTFILLCAVLLSLMHLLSTHRKYSNIVQQQ